MSRKAITTDDGLRYYLDATTAPLIREAILAFPRRYVCGCGRCEVICAPPTATCKCCQQYAKSRSYPDDGKRHSVLIRNGAMIEAVDFANKIKSIYG